jgi:hypothetical protein
MSLFIQSSIYSQVSLFSEIYSKKKEPDLATSYNRQWKVNIRLNIETLSCKEIADALSKDCLHNFAAELIFQSNSVDDYAIITDLTDVISKAI